MSRKTVPCIWIAVVSSVLVAISLDVANAGAASQTLGRVEQPPHRVVGNLYNVGIRRLSSWIVQTDAGLILIDSGFDEVQIDNEPDPARTELPLTPSKIRRNIEQLGLRVEDIRYILGSHAHRDHVGGHAQFRRWSGAKVMVMKDDAPAIRTGGEKGMRVRKWRWEPCEVDGELHDLSQVTLGNVTLTAHSTPGHTPGATTWSFQVMHEGKLRDVLILDSALQIAGIRWFEDKEYPTTGYDYLLAFARTTNMHVDVLLDTHGSFYTRTEERGPVSGNPFVDPEGSQRFLKSKLEEFLSRVDQQRRAISTALR